MSQGLCTVPCASGRIRRNQQYLRMYKAFTRRQPGCTLRKLIEHRKETGLFTGDPEQYWQID